VKSGAKQHALRVKIVKGQEISKPTTEENLKRELQREITGLSSA
jgi:hypothetical protein